MNSRVQAMNSQNGGGSLIRFYIKKVRRTPREDIRNFVRILASRRTSRALLNYLYGSLSLPRMQYWHTQYAKVFRGFTSECDPGTWRITFGGKKILLPVGGPEMWLEWDAALSILGHETEIKRAYASLIRFRKPKLFFDVGANYGLHSLLFLAHGVDVASFEPNPNCHSYFRRVSGLNGANIQLFPLALGAEEGTVNLWFPRTETWLGTTVASVSESFSSSEPIEVTHVRQTTLDQFTKENALRPDLIKIDIEGGEANVIRGGRQTLLEASPLIIFESWQQSNRTELFEALDSLDYRILTLRDSYNPPRAVENIDMFLGLPGCNLLAVPTVLSASVLSEL